MPGTFRSRASPRHGSALKENVAYQTLGAGRDRRGHCTSRINERGQERRRRRPCVQADRVSEGNERGLPLVDAKGGRGVVATVAASSLADLP